MKLLVTFGMAGQVMQTAGCVGHVPTLTSRLVERSNTQVWDDSSSGNTSSDRKVVDLNWIHEDYYRAMIVSK